MAEILDLVRLISYKYAKWMKANSDVANTHSRRNVETNGYYVVKGDSFPHEALVVRPHL